MESISMDQILLHIEHFLLPTADDRYLEDNLKKKKDYSSSPYARLDHVLYQVVLADHIRTIQIMYRDGEDEQGLASELRESDMTVKLTTKHLMEKLSEGRSRVTALCRSCYGDDSVESLRASVDLASSYALQGMWPQVSEHIAIASQQLISKATLRDQEEQRVKQKRGKQAALRVSCCYRVLRAHAIANRGQIKTVFLRELMMELSLLTNEEDKQDGVAGDVSVVGLNYATELTTELLEFFNNFVRDKRINRSYSSEEIDGRQRKKAVVSWGDLINYFREDCELMQTWIREVEDTILPQNRAALHLPFRQCDCQRKGVAHPAQLAATYSKFSNVLKVIAGSTLLKQLKDLKIEVPILIDLRTGQAVADGDLLRDSGDDNRQDEENTIRVVYELPVTWEEVSSCRNILFAIIDISDNIASNVLDTVICKHANEVDSDPLELLTSQILTLLGVSQVFSHKLSAAEENLKNALKQLEKLGLEMELNACELYNSIAQLMITKHRQWVEQRKVRLKRDAVDWLLGTEEGRADVKERIDAVKQHFVSKGMSYSTAEVEIRAKNMAIRERIKELLTLDIDPTRKALEAAYRYLVRSHEILESAHGASHPAVATGCLAVASVQNILGGYEESREWLVRALRCMERLDPLPVRAIAFVQLQLSQVLSRQGYEDESLNVLCRAASFHRSATQAGLLNITEQTPLGPVILNPPRKGQMLYDDILLAMDLTGRLIRADGRKGRVHEAAVGAEGVADLVDQAFGWDSLLAAEARREAGERYAACGDWARACVSLRQSLEALEAACGRRDKRTLEVARLLAAAQENKVRMQHLQSATERSKQMPYSNSDLGGDRDEQQEHDMVASSP